jgi:hypothetical protein
MEGGRGGKRGGRDEREGIYLCTQKCVHVPITNNMCIL